MTSISLYVLIKLLDDKVDKEVEYEEISVIRYNTENNVMYRALCALSNYTVAMDEGYSEVAWEGDEVRGIEEPTVSFVYVYGTTVPVFYLTYIVNKVVIDVNKLIMIKEKKVVECNNSLLQKSDNFTDELTD